MARIHIQRPNDEIIINYHEIKFIQKKDAGVFIYFQGGDEPLHLEGEAAEAFWDKEYEGSHKVYPKPEPEKEPYDPNEM
ncbi:MAG: hypothetical protein V7K88_13505 [Nostoc sp.]|uniref:hypothetical protein n=1 Tax=Nostoc sp. TaxID=1180 RepID=UPI002FF95075